MTALTKNGISVLSALCVLTIGAITSASSAAPDFLAADPGQPDFGFSVLPEGRDGAYLRHVADKYGGVLFVAAENGTVTVVDARTGNEIFTHEPAGATRSTAETDPLGAQRCDQPLIANPPRIVDAYVDGAWRSILLGSTGAGRSVFALDVTDPTELRASDLLWEFTDPELGLTVNQPTAVRLGDGTWAAVFGNGPGSQSRQGRLFMLDLQTGAQIGNSPIHVGNGSQDPAVADYGLSHIVPVDLTGNRVTDYLYGGDQQGNVWKFSPDSIRHPGTAWSVSFGTKATPLPLFQATDGSRGQAITARPVVGRHPEGGLMIYFGTGSAFSSNNDTDAATPQVQTFYAIRDTGSRLMGSRDSLQAQHIVSEVGASRQLSNRPVDYDQKNDWYLDLVSPDNEAAGEYITLQAILSGEHITIVSNLPLTDVCLAEQRSWLMSLQALNGGPADQDSHVDRPLHETAAETTLTARDSALPPATHNGERIDNLVQPPIVSQGKQGQEFRFEQQQGRRRSVAGVGTVAGNGGRQSWQELP